MSASGQVQAETLAAHFLDRVPQGFGAAYCSVLKRTRQTAETILNAHTDAPTLRVLDFLREIDYGPDENQPEDKVIARIGEAALAAWDRDGVPPTGWDISPDNVIAEWASLLDALSGPQESQPVLIVTSNGIARFVLEAVTRIECPLDSIKLKTGAYGLIRTHRSGATLHAWNERP